MNCTRHHRLLLASPPRQCLSERDAPADDELITTEAPTFVGRGGMWSERHSRHPSNAEHFAIFARADARRALVLFHPQPEEQRRAGLGPSGECLPDCRA